MISSFDKAVDAVDLETVRKSRSLIRQCKDEIDRGVTPERERVLRRIMRDRDEAISRIYSRIVKRKYR